MPPELPKAEVALIKQATTEQRAKVKVGDYAIYSNKMKAPVIGKNSEYQYKVSVISINGDEFTQLKMIKTDLRY